MQLTYEDIDRVAPVEDELAPEQTRNIPFFGFVAGTLISMALWGWIVWTVWVVIK